MILETLLGTRYEMTNDPCDDQMMLDLDVDSHIPVTSETVTNAINILGITDYQLLVDFLEPTEDEKQIIREVLNAHTQNSQ